MFLCNSRIQFALGTFIQLNKVLILSKIQSTNRFILKKCQISRREQALCLLVVGVNTRMTAVSKSTNNIQQISKENKIIIKRKNNNPKTITNKIILLLLQKT